MSVEGLPPRVHSFSHTCQSECALWAGPGDTAADEAVADAAPGAYVQNRDCSKGVDDVVMELDAIKIDIEEAKGRLGWSRVLRGKNHGVVSGAVRAKLRGWCGQRGWSRRVEGPVGGEEQPLARQWKWERGGATGNLGSPWSVHADAAWSYPSRRWGWELGAGGSDTVQPRWES